MLSAGTDAFLTHTVQLGNAAVKLTPEETQNNTLLQILFERGPAGARNISLHLVSELWDETRLRRGDLLDALLRLSAIGQLTITDKDDGDALLSLTVPGVIAARSKRSSEGQSWSQHLQ